MAQTCEMQTIRPSDTLGPALGGRPVAARLRTQIEQAVRRGSRVLVDFDGALMSPSFVDELFAKMSAEVRNSELVEFRGLSEGTQAFVRFTVDGRE